MVHETLCSKITPSPKTKLDIFQKKYQKTNLDFFQKVVLFFAKSVTLKLDKYKKYQVTKMTRFNLGRLTDSNLLVDHSRPQKKSWYFACYYLQVRFSKSGYFYSTTAIQQISANITISFFPILIILMVACYTTKIYFYTWGQKKYAC